ncbi:NAD-dependent deacylase [Pikeienuella piscinae]|uniref:NAD-dependent protein deacylase n=1 Tax=Pikeienuella piscinae TaxID=2748098 RepID=A0A7M3T6I8_9RHOB|nr:NAD-dependent deacylase [Pikeienuella piscinae]QIE57619.1 NAD-dependent deacylase [Pikeienuella piscinae]
MNIVILTGAGISAESGLGTFRDVGGLWTRYPLEDVATPEGFAKDPALVHEFYNMRRRIARRASPNAAHAALARLEAGWREAGRGGFALVTQNVDDLHERAGSRNVLHMHGELLRQLCGACGDRRDCPGDLSAAARCPACGAGALRPDVVWFGEIPYRMEEIGDLVPAADLFVSIGTSGEVYPAAGFAAEAARAGARTLELNLEPSIGRFDEAREGRASEIVPLWVAQMLAG